MVGLGLALAQPKHPPNLRIVVLDNECYGETGHQRTHTAMGVDLAAIARACGMSSLRGRENRAQGAAACAAAA
jgi:thiamine pyrophosphate-dependent acetolactate synthase large subunit-like protein